MQFLTAERSPRSGMQRNAKTTRAVRAILPSGRSAPLPARLAFDVSGSGTQMAAHESLRTTALYDRRDDQVAVDEVERILI
jgi:hypothetical protein